MKIGISFEEMATMAKEKTGQELKFEYVDGLTFKVSKRVVIPLIRINRWVGLSVEVVGFNGHDLRLRAASDILSWLVSRADGTAIREYADIDGRVMVVHLDKMESLKKAFDYIELRKINFSDEGVVLSADIKL